MLFWVKKKIQNYWTSQNLTKVFPEKYYIVDTNKQLSVFLWLEITLA